MTELVRNPTKKGPSMSDKNSPNFPQQNTLYYGDNLEILRDYIPNESIDLIYLDPPH